MKKTYIAHCSEGYYQYDRRVMVDEKLQYMPYAQAGVISTDDALQLVSYETIVAEITREWIKDENGHYHMEHWLHVYGLFSVSTRRHISAFLKEFAPRLSYYDAKACFLNDKEVNTLTGEIRDAAQGMIQTVGYSVHSSFGYHL